MAHGVTFMVAAITMAMATLLGFAAASPDYWKPYITVSIQNNFPTHNLTVQCNSDIEAHKHPDGAHLVPPKGVYMFSLDARMHHRWTCSLSTEKAAGVCSRVYSGKFIVWQKYQPPTQAPLRGAMCDGKCAWFVDDDGLSLIPFLGGKPVHIYNWPAHNYICSKLMDVHCSTSAPGGSLSSTS